MDLQKVGSGVTWQAVVGSTGAEGEGSVGREVERKRREEKIQRMWVVICVRVLWGAILENGNGAWGSVLFKRVLPLTKRNAKQSNFLLFLYLHACFLFYY